MMAMKSSNIYVLIKYIPQFKEMTVGMGSDAFYWAMSYLSQVKVNKGAVSVHWKIIIHLTSLLSGCG